GAAWVAAHPLAGVEPRINPHGPTVFCVGAGSRSKRWPLARWGALAVRLGEPVRPIAGEGEGGRFSQGERRAFDAMKGEYVPDLPALAAMLGGARLVVACDSGPAHLAATQLGVPTVAFFGPTDPDQWAPVGPCVRIVAPERAAPMEWLDV